MEFVALLFPFQIILAWRVHLTPVILFMAMLHVGLTGNIASGKSHTASLFAELGAHIIDADRIVHDLLACGTKTYSKIIEAFGPQILDQDRNIDRRRLAGIVFFDEKQRTLLNRLTHPDIHEEILQRIFELEQKSSSGIIMVDAALMVETGGYKMYHHLVVVACDPGLQLSRLMSRDALTEKEAIARIASQMPIEEKIKLADYTIDTSGTLKQTHHQVEAVYRDLLVQELRLKSHGQT
jgi:dephospho-CoA kinase